MHQYDSRSVRPLDGPAARHKGERDLTSIIERGIAAVRDRGVWATAKAGFAIVNPSSQRSLAARRRASLLRAAQARADADGCLIRRIHGSLMALDVTNEHGRTLEADLAVEGTREPLSTAYYLSALHELKRRWHGRRPVVVDIGANVGYYALMAANVFGDAWRVVAVEPDDDNVSRLRRNIELNGYTGIEVKQAAAGAAIGTGHLSRQSAANWHKMQEVANSTVAMQDVEVLTIDGIVEAEAAADAPVIVRMDIEGYEGHAWRGMSRLLASERDVFMFVEMHREALGMFPEMIAALRSGGFYVDRLEVVPGVLETGVDPGRIADVKLVGHVFLSRGLGDAPLASPVMI